MKSTGKKLLGLSVALFAFVTAFAQTTIKGTVVDADSKESIIGANVYVKGTTNGTSTSLDGSFTFKTNQSGDQTVVINFVGYTMIEKSVSLNGGEVDLGSVELGTDAIGLKEVNIVASVAIDRETPVAMSTLTAEKIERELGSQELPEVLNTTPGVYATKQGGGFGDSRINVRGFDQRNIAVMINGVPVNDMENGWVYWSNWSGLGDAIKTIQVQRGLGASKLAISSVGGTMNLITKTTDATKGGSFSASVTDYGNTKMLLSLSSGKMENGVAVSFVGSRTQGPGYVDQTWVDAWSYFFSVSKQFNDKHLLSFTAFGAPQKHGQRLFTVSQEVFDTYGNKYNQHWGWLDGQQVMERENYYHKPQMQLNHYWNISEKTFLATAVYAGFGTGGGTGRLGSNPGFVNGQINWEGARTSNQTHNDSIFFDGGVWGDGELIQDGKVVAQGQAAKTIIRNSVNNHQWYGLISTLKHNFNDNLKLMAGVDARYYLGQHYREVRNLLGADFYVERYRYAVDGVAGRSVLARTGDRIDYDNDGIVSYGGLFGQLEYSKDKLSAFLTASGALTSYTKVDRYNFVDPAQQKSEAVVQPGFNVKFGANYKVSRAHNVYANAGYYSRAPYFDFVFVNFNQGSLDPISQILNEKITAAELGYGYTKSYASFRLNGYYTMWNDRSITKGFTDGLGNDFTANIQGFSQTHAGIEADLTVNVTPQFQLGGMASLGSWVVNSDVSAPIFDDSGAPVDTVNIYADGLFVGDAPQTQAGIFAKYNFSKDFFVSVNYQHNSRLYADFDPTTRTNIATAGVQVEELPAINFIDVHAGYNFKFGNYNAYAGVNCYNLLNNVYIQEADNYGYLWSFGRNFNFTLKVNF